MRIYGHIKCVEVNLSNIHTITHLWNSDISSNSKNHINDTQ